jgi:hypothetical protein
MFQEISEEQFESAARQTGPSDYSRRGCPGGGPHPRRTLAHLAGLTSRQAGRRAAEVQLDGSYFPCCSFAN